MSQNIYNDDPTDPNTQVSSDAWRHYARDKFHGQEARMDAFEKKLDAAVAATERVELATADVVSTLASWNGAMQIIESTGRFLKPLTYIIAFCTAIIGFWVAVKHGFYNKD